jgi:Cu+-exporting ATPase
MQSTDQEQEKTIRLSVLGMRCAGCVQAVESALQSVPGVVSADVNFADHTALVRGDAARSAETGRSGGRV